MRKLMGGLWIALFLMPGAATANAVKQMPVVAHVGPWPVISQMIGYRGRVWFANSVKGRNHNSADLYSLDPAKGDVRYERHLFSQDAGEPIVHRGLLYWPYEDTRASLGWGAIEVTDGGRWRHLVVPSAQIFHTHVLSEWKGGLLAVTSAWRAGLQLSQDGGRTWIRLYDHTTAPGKVSRMGTFVVAADEAVAHFRGPGGVVRLVRWAGEGAPVNVEDWTQRERFHGLTEHDGRAYLVHNEKEGSRIWVVEGARARALAGHPAGWWVWDLASDGSRLYAVTRTDEGRGELWSSQAGEDWRLEARFEGGDAMSAAAALGAVYVGGSGEDGRGILWRFEAGAAAAPEAPAPPLPLPQGQEAELDFDAAAARLDEVLSESENFLRHGSGVLRELVYRIALSDPPAGLLAARLEAAMPEAKVALMGGSKSISARVLGEYILLWGMGVSRKGRVPLRYLERAWSRPPHRSEKYFDPLLTALWAVREIGQDDAATVSALIARLGHAGDPDWLQGDVVGVLTALTGERFGYDVAAWRNWQAARGE